MKFRPLVILILCLITFIYINIDEVYSAPNDLDSLKALPYVMWTDEKVETGKAAVTVYDKALSYAGYNLYTNNINKIYLMDMDGHIIHQWRIPNEVHCEYAELDTNNHLYVVCVNRVLYKLDLNSKIIDTFHYRVHHDVQILPDSSIVFIANDAGRTYNSLNVGFDSIYHIDSKGREIDKWSTFENLDELKKYHKRSALEVKKLIPENATGQGYDYYHTNTIEVLGKNASGERDERFQEGNWIVCLRNVNLIVILDKITKNVVWDWGIDDLDYPHMPTMLENGNILIYDNGHKRNHSRIIELNPFSKTIIWEYKASPQEGFHSQWLGSSQRLPNGNTLICESDKGRVFEITQEGKTVWEFWNPEEHRKFENTRGKIYRMMRYSSQDIQTLLDAIGQ